MSISALWTVDDNDGDAAEPLFQLSQTSSGPESAAVSPERGGRAPRTQLDYLGETMQCRVGVDRYYGSYDGPDEIVDFAEQHVLDVLSGVSSCVFTRIGQRPKTSPLAAFFGEPGVTDGLIARVVTKLFDAIVADAAGTDSSYSVRMGFSCFANMQTKPTDLLKSVRQHVPLDLEWGDVEGTMPCKYLYVTSAADALKIVQKLLVSPTFRPAMHRLTFCLHFLILKMPQGALPSECPNAKVAHLVLSDVHPDHTQMAAASLQPVLKKLQQHAETDPAADARQPKLFTGMPLSPRPLSPARREPQEPAAAAQTPSKYSSRKVAATPPPTQTHTQPAPPPARKPEKEKAPVGILSGCYGLLTYPYELPAEPGLVPAPACVGGSVAPTRRGAPCGDARLVLLGTSLAHGRLTPQQQIQLDALVTLLEAAEKTADLFARRRPAAAGTPPQLRRCLAAPSASPPAFSPPASPAPLMASAALPLPAPPGAAAAAAAAAPPASYPKHQMSPPPRPPALPLPVPVPAGSPQMLLAEEAAASAGVQRLECEALRRELQLLAAERGAERVAHAAEAEALRRRIEQLEHASEAKIEELQRLLLDQRYGVVPAAGSDLAAARKELGLRLLDVEQALLRSEQGREDAEMRRRSLASSSEDLKTQVAGLRASLKEMEASLQAEALGRDVAERELQELQAAVEQSSQQLSVLRTNTQDADIQLRLQHIEAEALKTQTLDLSIELEAERVRLRRLSVQLETAGLVELSRLEERESADRARLHADFLEGAFFLSASRHRMLHAGAVAGGKGSRAMSPPASSAALQHIDSVEGLRDRLTQRDAQLYAKTQDVLALESELVAIRSQVTDLQRAVERGQAALDERSRVLVAEKGALEMGRLSHSSETRRLAERANTAETEKQTVLGEMRKLRAQLTAAEEQLDEVTRQRSMAIQEAEMLRRKLAQSETYTDHHTMKLSAEMQQRELQIEDMQRQIGLLQHVADSHQGCERLRTTLQSAASESEARAKKLEMELASAEERLRDSEQRIAAELGHAQRAAREIAVLDDERQRTEVERRQRNDWVKSVELELEEKGKALAGTEGKLKEATQRCAGVEADVLALKGQLSSSRDEVLTLQRHLARCEEKEKSQALRDAWQQQQQLQPHPTAASPYVALPAAPAPSILRAEKQIAQLQSDLASMPPLPPVVRGGGGGSAGGAGVASSAAALSAPPAAHYYAPHQQQPMSARDIRAAAAVQLNLLSPSAASRAGA